LSILKTENLTYVYEDGTKALNNVNLSVEKGEKTAFLGANGSGKSTFFLCLNGILKPGQGRILFKDRPVEYSRKGLLKLRSKVGIVFQDPDNQLFSASVYQEISFGLMNLGITGQEAVKRVEAVMDAMEIQSFRHKPTHLLSGGQKKQVALADILVMEPEIIILDEPASALDPKHTGMINNILKRLPEQGITVIIATHDVDYALEWADKVVLFNNGEVIAAGKTEDIFMDKELLKQTNLVQPDVIKLYSGLCARGIIDRNLPVPKNFDILEEYIICSAGSREYV